MSATPVKVMLPRVTFDTIEEQRKAAGTTEQDRENFTELVSDEFEREQPDVFSALNQAFGPLMGGLGVGFVSAFYHALKKQLEKGQ